MRLLNLFSIKVAEIKPCADIENVAKELQIIANRQGEPIEFEFNTVPCVVNVGGDPDKLIDTYYRCVYEKPEKAES